MRLILILLLLCTVASTAKAQETRALIVSGVGGEPRLVQQFQQDAAALRTAIVQRFGAQATLLTEGSTPRSDRAAVTAALRALATDTKAGDRILIVFIGHGSAQSGTARFNIVGPDITGAEVAELIQPLKGREVAVVIATSSSGAFLSDLKASGRTVITATRSGSENEEVAFPRFFARALSEDVADADKDGAVSINEAFEFAKREVARFYQQQNRLATEHAMLTDTAGAKAFVLRSGSAPAAGNAELAAIQKKIDDLKARKAGMAASVYEAELENLLLELARKSRQLRGSN